MSTLFDAAKEFVQVKSSYTSVTGWNWDNKERGTDEVARRVGGDWVLTNKSAIMVMTKPKASAYVNELTVYQTRAQWRIKLGDTFKIPDKSVTQKAVDGAIYHVFMVPVFIQIEVAKQLHSVVGCIGCKPDGDAMLFNLKTNDPMFSSGDFQIISHLDFGETRYSANSPSYSPHIPKPKTTTSQNYDVLDTDEEEDTVASIRADMAKKEREHAMENQAILDELKKISSVVNVKYVRKRSTFEAERYMPEDERVLHEKRESLKAFEKYQKEMGEYFKYDEIDGKKVLNLSHMLKAYNEKSHVVPDTGKGIPPVTKITKVKIDSDEESPPYQPGSPSYKVDNQ